MSYEKLDNNRMHCIDSLTLPDAAILIIGQLDLFIRVQKE